MNVRSLIPYCALAMLIVVMGTLFPQQSRAQSEILAYDNGPFVNRPGQGPGGSDGSVLQSGMGTFGWPAVSGSRVADDFTIPIGQTWTISRIRFFAYQPLAPVNSSFSGLTLRIWVGQPGTVGAVAIWGDSSTNVLRTSAFAGAYRYRDGSPDTERPIFWLDATVNTVLTAGTYWLDWAYSGPTGILGDPHQMPITIDGRTTTGNALWAPGPAVDVGPQGFPFQIFTMVPTITIRDVSVLEGNSGTTNAVFTVNLSAPSLQTVSVSYTITNGTATAGIDYTSANGTVAFLPGETNKTITIAVIGDTLSESNEAFFVKLTGATNVIVGRSQGIVTIVNDDPPQKLWGFPTGAAIWSCPAIATDGTLYFGSADKNLYALNPDGSKRWAFPTGNPIFSSPTIGPDGTIYIGSYDHTFYAVNPNGTEKWRFLTGGDIFSGTAIGADGTIYFGSKDGKVYAFNPDGSKKWEVGTPGAVYSPSISLDGTICVGSDDGHLFAINPDSSLKWASRIGQVHTTPAFGADGAMYVTSADTKLHAFEPDGIINGWNGIHKWGFPTGAPIYDSSPAIGPDGVIYFGSWDNRFYAINPEGTLKWSFLMPHVVNSSPALGADGTIYVGCHDHNHYAIAPDGKLQWTFRTGGDVNSSPTIGPNGTLYFGSNDGHLYALNIADSLAQSPWPKYRNDARNTGRATRGTEPMAVTITREPLSQTVCAGTSATFSVGATGMGLSYQWRKGGVAIVGATASTYTINAVTVATVGTYDVVVSGTGTNLTSSTATLTVNTATEISSHPLGGSRCPGQLITFSVTASGAGPFSYQWRKGGTNISGAAGASYTIASVSAGDAGGYDVAVTGGCGNATSSVATLAVNIPVAITSPPVSQTVCPGTNVTFSVSATGTALGYQWRKAGVAIAGATNTSYTIGNVSTTNAGDYDVVVRGPCNVIANFFSLAVGCNVPPTVSITSPTNGAVFLAGTNIEIRTTASDPDGPISKVEFFRGSIKLGEDTTLPYSVIWSNAPAGSYTLTARATGDQGEMAMSAPVNIIVIMPTNRPPTVRITQPVDRTIFQLGEPIVIEAEANDAEGPVQRVEFYAGATKLGAGTASPFRFTWLGAAIGDYALTARAVDQGGLVGISEPVRIAVSDACGQVALVRNAEDPEIAKLQDYLYELGVKTVVFSPGEASVTNLLLFDLVVGHFGTNGPSNPAVDLFAQLALSGRALYFLGEALVSDSAQLTETNRSRWTELIHLQTKTGASEQQVVIDPTTAHEIIVSGKVGTVQNFSYGFSRGVSQALNVTGETVLGRAGDSDVLVAFQDFTVGGAGRRLTQTFGVASGTNEFSLGERKRLFQNAVWWLLNCRHCANLNVKPEDNASPPSVMVGETFSYKLLVRHNGACEALAVVVSSVLPSGMEFQAARTQRGQARYGDGIVTFDVGRMTSGATNEMEIVVRPTVAGMLTNYVALRSLNEESGALDDNRVEIVTEVLPTLRLQIEKPLIGPLQIKLSGPAGRTNVLDASSNFFDWVPVSTNELIGGNAVFADPQSATVPRRLYRGRLQ